jgi:ABC-type multidrug transport system ATPase subunit
MEFSLGHISFRYSPKLDYSLRTVDCSWTSTSVVGLAGANGSGKTTLIRVLLGELVEFEGAYRIDGQEIRDYYGNIMPDFGIGYSPDTPVLDEMLTGFEILCLVADIRRIEKEAFDRDLALLRENLQLGDWLYTQKCSEYSSGMRKRVSLAIAFLGSPKFTVLDEPTNGLDPLGVFGLKKIIAGKKERGCGCLVASHVLDFVEKIADKVLLLRNGALLYGGSLEGLMRSGPGARSLEEIYCTMFGS